MTAVTVDGRSWRDAWRGGWDAVAGSAATAAGWVSGMALGSVRWLPGVACGAGVTVGMAMVVHAVFRQVPELGVGLLAGGVFCGMIDKRIP